MRGRALVVLALAAACSGSSDATPVAPTDGGTTDGGLAEEGGPTGDAGPGCIADITREATSASSVARADAPGAIAWQGADKAIAADATPARAELGAADETENLVLTGFGFSAPAGMHVAGVEVELQRQSPAADVMDGKIFLLVDSQTSQTFHYVDNAWPSSIIGTHLYGDVDDMWGMQLTNADVAKPSFGVSLYAKRVAGKTGSPVALVDALRMTVIYCPN